jgi:hypothetical protein
MQSGKATQLRNPVLEEIVKAFRIKRRAHEKGEGEAR